MLRLHRDREQKGQLRKRRQRCVNNYIHIYESFIKYQCTRVLGRSGMGRGEDETGAANKVVCW